MGRFYYKDDCERIEHLVVQRRTQEIRRETAIFLKRHKSSQALFQVCDWYRRLGRYEDAFRLLEMNEPVRSAPKSDEDRARLLWAARLLNLLGATELAEDFLRFFEPHSAEEHRIVGTIRMVQLDHDSAVKHFEKWYALELEPKSYRSRLNRINFADALNDSGRTDEALSHLREVERDSQEPLLQAITLGSQGELQARQQNWEVARRLLTQALKRFPKRDRSPDRGFVLKWLGYTLLNSPSPKASAGMRALRLSLAIIRRAGLRPEAWLDIYRLQALSGQLDVIRLSWLMCYPGLSPNFRASLPEIDVKTIGPPEACLELDLGSNEYRLGSQWHLGIPDELRAAAAIVQTGEWGIPLVKLKSLLWRGQAHAFPQLEGRLHQIFRRLRRRYAIELTVEDGYVRARPLSRSLVRVHLGLGASRRPSFLERNAMFSRKQVGNHYGLSSNQTCQWVKQWIDLGWIRRMGSGPATHYVLLGNVDCPTTKI